MFDYHVHSQFSADCKSPMEEMIQGAIQRGIQEICFTEHIDEDYPDPTISFELDLLKYNNTIKYMQNQYGGKIAIKKGVELGIQPHVIDSYKVLLQNEKFDFIICSMHTTKGLDLHSGHFFEGKNLSTAYEEYYSELLACVKEFNQFSILGHLDLVSRYKYESGVNLCLDIIDEIFKVIIPMGKGLEINTSGYYYGLNRLLPSVDILKLYKERNGEIITIGSDAHQPERLAEYYPESIELLKNIGFRYISTFTDMKPTFHKI